MEASAGRSDTGGVRTSEHGLKADAISFWEGLVVALASTAPAYSLAAVIGSMAVIVGFFAPAALMVAFIPMFFIAAAFYWMNKADQDCGTTFAWVTRAMGPNTGWIAGWAVFMTGVLVVGSLADVATYTFYDLIDAQSLYESEAAVVIGAVVLIGLMTTDPKTVRNFLFIGLGPAVGAVILTYIFVKALFNFSDPANSYTGHEWLGVAPPAVIGVGMLLLGVIMLFAWRLHKREPFFKRRPETADPALLEPAPQPTIAGGSE